MKHWIQSHGGRKVGPGMAVLDINIYDIAHSLARICRFNGHTVKHYSVAQHSVHVSDALETYYKDDHPDRLDALKWGLLHDAAEAYIGDIPRPIKKLLGQTIVDIETDLLMKIAERFDLPWPIPASIHEVDNRLLYTEKRDLLQVDVDWGYVPVEQPFSWHVFPQTIEGAWWRFMDRFAELFGVDSPHLDVRGFLTSAHRTDSV